jgi:hypothetical protein
MMLPHEFDLLQPFKQLPIYEDGDPRTGDLLQTTRECSGEVMAADNLACALWWLRQPGWEPRGTICQNERGQTRLLVIFWKRRQQPRRLQALWGVRSLGLT